MVHSDALSIVADPLASCHVTPPSGTYSRAITGAAVFIGSLPGTYLRSSSTASVAFCASLASPVVGPNTSRTGRSSLEVLVKTTRPYTTSIDGEPAGAATLPSAPASAVGREVVEL